MQAPFVEFGVQLVARMLIVVVALLSGAGAMVTRAVDREPPRVAHYGSEFARVGFILDLSGELPKLKFDGSEEILVLRWQPAAGGDRLLVRDDGEVLLRLSGLGGMTLFTPALRGGTPVAPDRQVPPLLPALPPISVIRDIAGRIMMQLRAETGKEILIEADWNAVAGDPGARGILFDAIRNAGTALFDVARSGPGRAAMANYLKRVRFVHARQSGIFLQGDMLVVNFSAAQGLAGRPSSFAIMRQLRQIFR